MFSFEPFLVFVSESSFLRFSWFLVSCLHEGCLVGVEVGGGWVGLEDGES